MPEGIRKRHAPSCPAFADPATRCRCRSGYEASVYNATSRRKIRKSFPTVAAAKAWRADAHAALATATHSHPSPITIRQASERLIDGMRTGLVRTRSGEEYKPSVIESYKSALELRILPQLGALKLSELRRQHAQTLINQMLTNGASPSTIRNTLIPLRVILRCALDNGELTVNPLTNLRLPAVRGKRDRIIPPAQAEQLLNALPPGDRALWATALYAGLRRGELLALTWHNIDLPTGRIHITHSYDLRTQTMVAPKSSAGIRTVPIAGVLRDYLTAHKARTRQDHGLVFGRTPAVPFDIGTYTQRANRHWHTAGLTPIRLHECRHTFASLMIAAGVNLKALSTYLGHASITITLDRYGHLLPGNETEAATLLDTYLEKTLTNTTQQAA